MNLRDLFELEIKKRGGKIWQQGRVDLGDGVLAIEGYMIFGLTGREGSQAIVATIQTWQKWSLN